MAMREVVWDGGIMLKIREATDKAGRRIAVVHRNGKVVASASMLLIDWMRSKVPDHQLSPTQAALVEWYATKKPSHDVRRRREHVS